MRDTGVVYPDVDAPERLDEPVDDGGGTLLWYPHIERLEDDRQVFFAQSRGGFHTCNGIDVRDHGMRSRLREAGCHYKAETACRAGDDDDFVPEF